MPGAVLRLRGRRAKVRSDDDVVAAEQRVLGEGLGRENVEGRAADLARLEAASSASRSTSSPRAQLTIRTPSFICAIASASIQLTVSGVFGRWIVMMSALAYSSSVVSARSTPSSRKRSAATNLSKAITSISNACARLATSWPIRPKPITPRVLP